MALKTFIGSLSTTYGTGGNWSPAGVPTVADDAQGNGSSLANAVATASRSVNKLSLLAGYTKTFDFAASPSYTITTTLIVNAGTIKLPSPGVLSCNGISNTVGGTINYGSGKVLLIGGNLTVDLLVANRNMFNVEINSVGNISATTEPIIKGKLTLTSYNALQQTWRLEGDLDANDRDWETYFC